MIIGLLGGVEILKYSIADILWKKISELSGLIFEFKIISAKSFTEVHKFYNDFYRNEDFGGFNVALPWKTEIIKLVDFIEAEALVYNSINVVCKKEGRAAGFNTDVIGLERAILGVTSLGGKKILILGAGGAGLSTAIFLGRKYDCTVHVYDINVKNSIPSPVVRLNTFEDVTNNIYDIIINATPVGRYYLDEIPTQFLSPLSLDIVQKITHKKSIIQEMNYFPFNTQLMKFGQSESLIVISGIYMLVYQALETLKLYVGYQFDKVGITKLADYMKNYAINKENELLQKGRPNS